jgi:lycopene cyclase domain-containing protein
MTYFGVLLRFIGPPLVLLIAITIVDGMRGRRIPPAFRTWPPWAIVLGHVLLALVYTTPWDNYLVATGVWWYDPALVTGLTLGWVPIEEYTFFVVQTLMGGLWVLFWMRRADTRHPADREHPADTEYSTGSPKTFFFPRPALRWITAGIGGLLWVVWLALLLAGWTKGRYMSLILVWFLPPILLQLAFGADILWHHRRLVSVALVPPTLYLWLVDGLAIRSGTWAINPQDTVGLDLLGVLPIEEATFFLVTNVLISFGIVLMLARESHRRAGLRTAQREQL